MNYREMTKNSFFREFTCGLTVDETANLCFKSVRTVKEWDKGKDIPRECKRLMKLHNNREVSHKPEWEGFRLRQNKLEIPTGQLLTPQEIIMGAALVEIKCEDDLRTSRKLLKMAKAIARVKTLPKHQP